MSEWISDQIDKMLDAEADERAKSEPQRYPNKCWQCEDGAWLNRYVEPQYYCDKCTSGLMDDLHRLIAECKFVINGMNEITVDTKIQ